MERKITEKPEPLPGMGRIEIHDRKALSDDLQERGAKRIRQILSAIEFHKEDEEDYKAQIKKLRGKVDKWGRKGDEIL